MADTNNVNMSAEINVEFNEALSRQSLDSGDNITILFGKLKRWISDLKAVSFTGSYDSLLDKPIIPIHYETSEYWNSQNNLVGEKGHIYIYSDYAKTEIDGNQLSVPNIKIGDGNAYLIDSPFVSTSIEDLLNLHITDTIKHITEQDRKLWNEKVRCYLDSEDSEKLIFTTD
jgi:hypothetical protein